MVEAINQSGARIFLGVNLEEIVARGMKMISLREEDFFACFLGINEFGELITERKRKVRI